MLRVNNLAGFGSGRFPTVNLTFVDHATIQQVSGNNTFSGINFGPASSNRYIVVCTTALTTVTIGGISATKVASITASPNGSCAIWIAAVPTGTSGTVVANGSSSQAVSIAVYAMTGNASATPGATATSTANPPSAAIAIPTRGVAIAFALSENAGAPSWTGLTQDVDLLISSSFPRTSAAHLASNSTQTVTAQCTMAGNNGVNALVAASWGP